MSNEGFGIGMAGAGIIMLFWAALWLTVVVCCIVLFCKIWSACNAIQEMRFIARTMAQNSQHQTMERPSAGPPRVPMT